MSAGQDPHESLTKEIEQIFRKAGFKTDREVVIEIKEGGDSEKFNLDVCAVYNDLLIITECKAGSDLKLKNLILEWVTKKEKINAGNVKVIKSARKFTTASVFKKIETVRVLFAVDKFEVTPMNYQSARREKMNIWDAAAINYYVYTASVLENWTKFEIMRELGVQSAESKRTISPPAIQIKQPGGKCYVTALHPSDLLKIAYVYRRSLGEKEAYQRIIKRGRLAEIAKFESKGSSLLPNNVILAFESKVKFHESSEGDEGDSSISGGILGELTIPLTYCSAWVVDGQHRLFGFTRTKYSKQSEERFEVPVVAFEGLPTPGQARMFIDINNNQKKMDKTLLSDLMTVVQDMSEPLTWPSMLVKKLKEAQKGPWKDRIQILVIQKGRSINLYGFARYALLQRLLRPVYKHGELRGFSGPPFKYARFDYRKSFSNPQSIAAFQKQLKLLNSFFTMVAALLSNPNKERDRWTNFTKYGATRPSGVNALMLVLVRILETGKPLNRLNLPKFLKPITKARWTNDSIKRFGRGWDSFRGLADELIRKLNSTNRVKLKLYGTN